MDKVLSPTATKSKSPRADAGMIFQASQATAKSPATLPQKQPPVWSMRTRAASGFFHALRDQIGEFTNVMRRLHLSDSKTDAKRLFHGHQKRDVNQRIPFRHVLGAEL